MRIIAGNKGGRGFQSPNGHKTHPMSDKVRGAIFNSLGDIEGLTILDAFGGSGALSFEALSRGAKSALIIESDKNAQKTIEDNITELDFQSGAKLIKASANAWLSTSDDSLFDIIFLDPPYQDLQVPLLQRLITKLSLNGIVVLSWPGSQEPPLFNGLKIAQQKQYGDAQLVFYK